MNDQMQVDLIRDVNLLDTKIDKLKKPEVSRLLIDPFLDLPGKVGLWYAGDVQLSTGNIYDSSKQGRTLTYNGNPVFNQLGNGIAYCAYDGTGDYHSRPDETDLRVLGTEGIFDSDTQGLTIGGWFYVTSIGGGSVQLIGKSNPTGNQYAYQIIYNPGNTVTFRISPDGSTLTDAATSGAVSTGVWFFVVGRFVPGDEVSVFINGMETLNNAGISAAIFNSSSAFDIGSFGGGNFLTGYFSIGFLSANALPDVAISRLFNQTRVLYGV